MDTSDYFPISMSHEWSWMWRLFFAISFTGIGTIINTFFVATFFISPGIRNKGNISLCCLGLCDMIITTLLGPGVLVVMLSQIKEREICRILQFLVQWSTYVYSLFYMLVAVDSYARLVRGLTYYQICITYPFGTLAILNFLVTFTTVGAGVYYELDYDYCNRNHYGNYWFRLVTSVVFCAIPCIVTIYLLLYTWIVMKNQVVTLIRHDRYQFEMNKNLTYLHLLCYIMFVTTWIPYLVLVNRYSDATETKYYGFVYIGLVRSAITSIFYSAMNKNIRRAFHDLFDYFGCKGYALNKYPRNSFDRNNGMQVQVLESVSIPSRERGEPPVQKVL